MSEKKPQSLKPADDEENDANRGASSSGSPDKPKRPSPLERLNSDVANERARGLLWLSTAPDKSEEVVTRVEELLEDHSAAMIGVPYLFGEIRFLAAQALAVVRARMGNPELVKITDCPRTVTDRRIGSYAEPYDLKPMSGEKLYAALRDLGALPTRDYVFDPAEYPSKSRRELADEAASATAARTDSSDSSD